MVGEKMNQEKNNKIKKGHIAKMLSYYRPYMGIFWADMFFATVSAAVALTIPLVVRFVTNKVVYMNPSDILKMIPKLILVLVALLAIDAYSRFFIGNYGHVMGAKIEYNMRSEIFSHMQKLSFSFYDDAKVGSLMSRITSDLFDITELLHHGPENIILSFLKIFGALVILANINIYLTLAAFIIILSILKIGGALIILSRINGWMTLAAFIVLPFMLAFALWQNNRMRAAFKANRVKVADINAQIEDNLSGIRVVKSFANEDVEEEKFRVGNDGFLSAKKNSYLYMGIFQSGINFFTTLIQVCVILVGCVLIAHDTITISDMITFLLYIGVFTDPIRVLVDFTEQFQNGYTGFERFREIMEIDPDVKDAPDAKELRDVKGNIVFENVSFRYNEGSDKVLSHVDLNIEAGSYYALVGSSGAGKTTLCSLIPRFYDVTGGKITIDGTDIRDVTLKSLRNNIGIVQQDVYLFAGTIFENIAYGKSDATMEEVIEAAKNANAHDFILSFPDGYDTDIGQRGIKLSGGQKQRLSIARVFLKNPPILIFDEATSSLDNESEKVVQESLEKLAKNRTTLVIAHRLTTIQNAEQILVLTEDGIAENGTHEELLAKKGIYEHLYHVATDK